MSDTNDYSLTSGGFDPSINPKTGIEYSSEDLARIQQQNTPVAVYPTKRKKKALPPPVDPIAEMVKRAERNPYTGALLSEAEIKHPGLIRDPKYGSALIDKTVYNINLDDYSGYMDIVRPNQGVEALNQQRAQGQSTWAQAGNAIGRTVANTALDIVGGLASMADIEDYANTDNEVGNWLTDATERGKANVNNALPIYRENPNQSLDVGDPAWWFENGSSLVSSVASFAVQGIAVGATLGAGAAGMTRNASALIQKLAQAGVKGATAMGMNQAESILSAAPVFKDNLDHYLALGVPEDQARAKAAADATDVININRANTLLNLTSASMFTRAGAQSALSRELRNAPVKLASRAGMARVGLEAGQEFLEEQINYISEKEGRSGIAGMSDGNLLSALTDTHQMSKNADDAGFWEAGILGAIGGAGQHAVSKVYRKASGKTKQELEQYLQQEKRIAEMDQTVGATDVFKKTEALRQHGEEQKNLQAELDAAIEEKDVVKVAAVQQKIQESANKNLYYQTVTSLNDGTTGQLVDSFKKITNMTEEELATKQFPADARERAQNAVDFIEDAEKTFNTHSFKSPKVRNQLVENSAKTFIHNTEIKGLQKDIADVSSQMTEMRSTMSSSMQSLEDETVGEKNADFKNLLMTKRHLEKLHDAYADLNTKLSNEKATLLKKNYTKREGRRILSKEDQVSKRQSDAFKENLQDRLNTEPDFDIVDLYSVKDSLENSTHPNKESHIKAVDELISHEREKFALNLHNQGKQATKEVISGIKDNVVALQRELGLSPKAADKVSHLLNQITDNTKPETAPTIESSIPPGDSAPETGVERSNQTSLLAPANESESKNNNIDGAIAILMDDAYTPTVEKFQENLAQVFAHGQQLNQVQNDQLNARLETLARRESFQNENKDVSEKVLSFVGEQENLLILGADHTNDGVTIDTYEDFPDMDVEEKTITEDPGTPSREISSTEVRTIDTQFTNVLIQRPELSLERAYPLAPTAKGLYIQAVDKNGNLLPQPATGYKIGTQADLQEAGATPEQLRKATQLFWYPVRISEQTGYPLKGKKGQTLYHKTGDQIKPILKNGLTGGKLLMIHDVPLSEVVYQDEVLDFKAWNTSSTDSIEGKKVYLKKNQYNNPKTGEPLYVGKDWKDEVITVHLTPDGPPVQKIAAGESYTRKNFDSLMEDGKNYVEMEIVSQTNGSVINHKDQNGKSIQRSIGFLGKPGTDFVIGYGKENAVFYSEQEGPSRVEKEYTAVVESGAIYLLKRAVNGSFIPIRVETTKITKKDADTIIDKILQTENGNQKATDIQGIVATIANHNMSDGEKPGAPLFFVDSKTGTGGAVKLRLGSPENHIIVSVDHTEGEFNGTKFNNLKQALAGESFTARLYATDKNNYGEALRVEKADGKFGPKTKKFTLKDGKLENAEGLHPDIVNAIENFRASMVKSITEKNYQVDKNSLGFTREYKSQLEPGITGETYEDYLIRNNILTTDVSPEQSFYNSKATLVPTKAVKEVIIETSGEATIVDATAPEKVTPVEEETELVIFPGDHIEAVNSAAEPIQEQAEDDEISSEDLDTLFNDIDFRTTTDEKFESSPENILTEVEIRWILDTYGEEHLAPMAQAKYVLMRGTKAYGAYSNGIISLARLGAKGTAYHEGFHLAYDLGTTEKEKEVLQSEARKTFSVPTGDQTAILEKRYPSYSPVQIENKFYEEEMAEGFRSFMEAEESNGRIKATTVGKMIQKFFDRLRKMVLSIRIAYTQKMNPDSVYLSAMEMKRQFLQVKTGGYPISTESKTLIESKNPNEDPSLRSKPGWTEEQKHDVVNSMRHILVSKVYPNMVQEGKTTAPTIKEFMTNKKYSNDFEAALEGVRTMFGKYSDVLGKLITQHNKEGHIKAKKYVDAARSDEGWNTESVGGVVESIGFKDLLKQSMAVHGAKFQRARLTDEMIQADIAKMDNEALDFGETHQDEDENDSTSGEKLHDISGELVSQKKSMTFDVKTALSFIPKPTVKNPITGEILQDGNSKFIGLPTFIDVNTAYATVKSKLADVPMDLIENKLKEISVFNPTVKAIYDAYTGWSPEIQNGFKSVMAGTQLKFLTIAGTDIIETNRQSLERQIIDGWASNRTQKNLFISKEGVEVVDPVILSDLIKEYYAVENLIYTDSTRTKIKTGIDPVKYYEAVTSLFAYVGIDFDAETQRMFQAEKAPALFQSSVVEGLYGHIVRAMGWKRSATNGIGKEFALSPYSSEGTKGQSKTFKSLAKLVINIRTDLFTGSFTNGKGKMVYSLNLNSYSSLLTSRMKDFNGIAQLYNEFKNDPFYSPDLTGTGDSILLTVLHEDEKVRREFGNFLLDTIKEERGAEGKDYSEMDDKLAHKTRLAMFHNRGQRLDTGFAYFNGGTPSDKSQSRYFKLPILNSKIHSLQDHERAQGIQRTFNAAKSVLMRNIRQEHARIMKVQKQLETLDDADLIENYHYKMVNGVMDKTKANGLLFLSIPDLNFNEYGLFKEGKVVEDLSTKVRNISKALDSFLEREVLRGKENMAKSGLIFEREGKYYSSEISTSDLGGSMVHLDGIKDKVNDVDEILSEFLLNELVWATELSKFNMGDLAFYKTSATNIDSNNEFPNKTGVFYSVVKDAGKRAYQAITPGLDHVLENLSDATPYGKSETMAMAVMDDIYVSTSNKDVAAMMHFISKDKNWNPLDYVNGKSTNDLTPDQSESFQAVMAYKKGSNKADAQGYTSLTAHKKTMMGRGEWTIGPGHTHEQAEKWFAEEEDYTKWPDWVQRLALKPLKTFSWGYQYDDTLQMMIFKQIKHSTVPLYPAFTKLVPQLDKLRQRMDTVGEFAGKGLPKIDVVNMESAVKIGKTRRNTYSKDGDLSNLQVQTIYSKNERSPFVLPSEKGTDPKDGSQFLKLITANMPIGALYTSIAGVDSVSTEDLQRVMDAVYVEKIKRTSDKLSKDLGYDDLMSNPNDRIVQLTFLKKVQNLLLEQIESRELPDNYSIALEIQELESGEAQFAMPLSFPAYAKKFEIAFTSLFKSRILTQRLPGDAAVQVAEYGIDDTNDLKYFRVENGKVLPAECAISYKEAIKLGIDKFVGEDGTIDYNVMEASGIDKSILHVIGYRIPTQGKSSMIAMIVKKILPPSAKGQIMLPGEITTQTGSDYDVDKMFLYYPALEKTENGIQKVQTSEALQGLISKEGDISKLSDKQIQNILFESRFGILVSEHNFHEVVTPLDSKTYPDKMKEYEKLGLLEDANTYNFSSYYTNLYLEMINKDAKKLVGIFSAHSVAQALSQKMNIVLNTAVKISINGIDEHTDLQGKDGKGLDGRLRSAYVTENQNAAVDNAKDPITGSLNINTFTANIVALFNRLGINNDIAVDFVNQPIIRILTKEYALSGDFTPSNTAKNLIKSLELPTKYKDGKVIKYDSKSRLKVSPASLLNTLKSKKTLDQMSEEELQMQTQILQDFLEYYKAGTDLAKANKAISPDRFVSMSGLGDIEVRNSEMDYIINPSSRSSVQILDVYTGESSSPVVKAFYEHGILKAENILSHFMPYNNTMFTNMKNGIARLTGQENGRYTDIKVISALNSALFSAIMLDVNSPVRMYMDGMTHTDLNRMLFDRKESTAARLDQLKRVYKLQGNTVLKMISSDGNNAKNPFQLIKFNSASDMSGDTISSYVDALEELILRPGSVVKVKRNPATGKYAPVTAEEKEKGIQSVKNVIQELLVYSMVSSGFQSGPNSMIDLVPISFWKNMFLDSEGRAIASISKYLYDFQNQMKANDPELLARFGQISIDGNSEDIYTEQILRNIFPTNKLVKTAIEKTGIPNSVKATSSATEEGGVMFTGSFTINQGTNTDLYYAGEAPMYLKMYDLKNKKWRLYKKENTESSAYDKYSVLQSLGEPMKFFEINPHTQTPVSIHPRNGKITKAERVQITPPAERVNILPEEDVDVPLSNEQLDDRDDLSAIFQINSTPKTIQKEEKAIENSQVLPHNLEDIHSQEDIGFGMTKKMRDDLDSAQQSGELGMICE